MNISRCLLVAAIALSASPIFAASQGADVAKIGSRPETWCRI